MRAFTPYFAIFLAKDSLLFSDLFRCPRFTTHRFTLYKCLTRFPFEQYVLYFGLKWMTKCPASPTTNWASFSLLQVIKSEWPPASSSSTSPGSGGAGGTPSSSYETPTGNAPSYKNGNGGNPGGQSGNPDSSGNGWMTTLDGCDDEKDRQRFSSAGSVGSSTNLMDFETLSSASTSKSIDLLPFAQRETWSIKEGIKLRVIG